MLPQLIDTHAHLDEEAFRGDLDDVIRRARDAGVCHIITIGITAATSENAVRISEQHSGVSAVVGIQPNYTTQAKPGEWETVCDLATHQQVVAIGETGLDRYWDYAPADVQADYFDRHLQLAQELNKPVVIHCRDAEAEVVSQLRCAAGTAHLHGVMHSFAGDAATADACLELGLHISFSGMVTYRRNDKLREVASMVPAERLLIETDAPYLTPVPLRGKKKRNEPCFVVHTAQCMAAARRISIDELARQTTAGARRLFGIDAQL